MLRHLVPNILIPLPLMTIQSIRKFLKVLEKTLSIVLKKVPQVIIEQKQKVLKVFTLQLKRYTSLNYMSQSVTSAFGQPDMLSVMVQDWNKIDFEIIKEQGSWITECPLSILTQICTYHYYFDLSNLES